MTEHIILDKENPSVGNTISEVQALAFQDLDWITWVDSNADGTQQFYNRTEQSEAYGKFVSDLTFTLENEFPDVLAAASLAIKPAPFKNVRPEPGDVEESDFMATLLSIFPDAEVDMDSDGQITINTGLFAIGGRQALRGRFVKPQPAIGPAPEGYTRVMVLDDGGTFSGLSGCQIKDVIDEDLQDVDDLDNLDPDAWSFVASFNADGLEV